MRLLQLNDKMINMDQVTVIERKDAGHVIVSFVGGNKNLPDLQLSKDEGTKLWDYLRDQSQDLMA